MGETLDALHALQGTESKLAAIRGKADGRKRQIRVHQRALQKHESLVQEKHQALQSSQIEVDSIDLEVKSKEQSLGKHREALNRAKTNKEYAAILTAINTEKADNTKLESRQLEMMDKVDVLRAETGDLDAERKRIIKRLEEAQESLEQFVRESAPDLKKLERQRDTVAEKLAPGVLNTFRRVAEIHDGVAMAEVMPVNTKRDEYACGSCNMSMTLQQVIGCKERDDIVLCGSCGCIMYLTPEGKS